MPRKDLSRRSGKILALVAGLALLLVQIPASGAAGESRARPRATVERGSTLTESADNWFVLDPAQVERARLRDFGSAKPISWTPDVGSLSRSLQAAPETNGPVVSIPPRGPSSRGVERLRRNDSILRSDVSSVSTEITDPTVFPYRIHGKVEVQFSTGVGACSGTVVTSDNSSVVMTAAHCLVDSTTGEPASAILFAPGYRLGNIPFGVWEAEAFGVTPEWVNSIAAGAADFRYDVGAFVLEPDSSDQKIGDLLGTRGIIFNQPPNQLFDSFGYPVAAPFDGERLFLCDSGPSILLDGVPPPQPHGIECDMTQGSSGGGWVLPSAQVNSVNSFKFLDDPNTMYGPQFGASALDLYELASEYPPDRVNHKMTVSIELSGHLVVKGTMKAKDGYKPCTRGALINIFKKNQSANNKPRGGKNVESTTTNSKGKFRTTVPDKPGKYYVKSPKGLVDDANHCSAAKSKAKRHKH